jgi:hypothetical protein
MRFVLLAFGIGGTPIFYALNLRALRLGNNVSRRRLA